MKKREEFAVSLRKKKTHDLINAKRRKLMTNMVAGQDGGNQEFNKEEESKGASGEKNANTMYKGYQVFEQDSECFEKMLDELCPVAMQADRQLD